MNPFTYDAIPGRVVFGAGSIDRLAAEADVLGARRVMLIASEYESGMADRAGAILGDRIVGRFTDVVQHVPAAKAAASIETATELGADGSLKYLSIVRNLLFALTPGEQRRYEKRCNYPGETDRTHN